jgi:lipopolysaccharide export system protein LptA
MRVGAYVRIKKTQTMKKFLFTLGLATLMSVGGTHLSFAQKTDREPKMTFKADEVSQDAETGLLTLIGNVSLDSELLSIKNADEVLVDKKGNTVSTSTGTYSWGGTVVMANQVVLKSIRFELDSRVAYLE